MAPINALTNKIYQRSKLERVDLNKDLLIIDGFVTGVLACPEDIKVTDWLRKCKKLCVQFKADHTQCCIISGSDILSHFELVKLSMAKSGSVNPIFLRSQKYTQDTWGFWVNGFVRSTALNPIVWQKFFEHADSDIKTCMTFIQTLHDISYEKSSLPLQQIQDIRSIAYEALPQIINLIIEQSRGERLILDCDTWH